MKIKTILEYELKNNNDIFLFQEGCFLRAYNRSAMRFVKEIKQMKILQKYIKCMNETIFYCGFPVSQLIKIKELIKEKKLKTKISNKGLNIININTKNENYNDWKNNISTKDNSSIPPKKGKTFIIDKIKNYPINNRTPQETIQFVYELKELIEIFSKQ